MLPRDVDPLLDVEYERGRFKRLRVGRSAARLLLALGLLFVVSWFGARGALTWKDIAAVLPWIVRP
jgi:hypothetical protein